MSVAICRGALLPTHIVHDKQISNNAAIVDIAKALTKPDADTTEEIIEEVRKHFSETQAECHSALPTSGWHSPSPS
jgi:hypothetical protein